MISKNNKRKKKLQKDEQLNVKERNIDRRRVLGNEGVIGKT